MLWIDPFSETFVVFLCNCYVEGAIAQPYTSSPGMKVVAVPKTRALLNP